MKKTIFRMKMLGMAAVALLLGGLMTSCVDEVALDSTTSDFYNVTVTNDQWVKMDDGNFYFSYYNPEITADVLNYGNVSVYLLLNDNGTDYYTPLPYVYRAYYDVADDGTGNPGTLCQPVTVRYDMIPGLMTLQLSDLSWPLAEPNDFRTMRFRVVITKPVTYIIEQ